MTLNSKEQKMKTNRKKSCIWIAGPPALAAKVGQYVANASSKKMNVKVLSLADEGRRGPGGRWYASKGVAKSIDYGTWNVIVGMCDDWNMLLEQTQPSLIFDLKDSHSALSNGLPMINVGGRPAGTSAQIVYDVMRIIGLPQDKPFNKVKPSLELDSLEVYFKGKKHRTMVAKATNGNGKALYSNENTNFQPTPLLMRKKNESYDEALMRLEEQGWKLDAKPVEVGAQLWHPASPKVQKDTVEKNDEEEK
jgi:hypothetical protein